MVNWSPTLLRTDPTSRRRAYAAARAICRRHARSFHFASRFLPGTKRRHAYAVYAFCRLLDDAADVRPSVESVERFERLLDAIYEPREPATPLQPDHEETALALLAFADTVQACNIPKRYFLDLARGCRMDFTVDRYASFDELERYCYHVAGVVGLIMCRVFDLRDDSVLDHAVRMGNAMQLTNILRDVKEDLQRGRIYLPREDLDRFGVTEPDLLASRCDDRFRALMRFEVARARSMYRNASEGLAALPRDGSRQTACVMSVVYAGILDAIERQDYNVFARRARIGWWQKLRRVPRALTLSRREPGQPLPDVFRSEFASV